MLSPKSPQRLACFKAYDVRGQIGKDIDTATVERIGYAFASIMQPNRVVIGHDCRTTSATFSVSLAKGLSRGGADVLDIGLAGTEEVYFATDHFGADGGIEITASHNPIDYNGLKLVGPGSRPLTEAEFQDIATLAANEIPSNARPLGTIGTVTARDAYADHVTAMIDAKYIPPCKIVVNAGNGVAGPAFDAILEKLLAKGAPIQPIRINHLPDGTFPKGIPNPLLPENRSETSRIVTDSKADLGIAWDGDFDRCFFFDETGTFVDGEYVVGLLAAALLETEAGATIVHDPRVIWNTQAQVHQHGGTTVFAKTGHAHAKRVMRESGAIYGGEISAHHYFRDFMCCDSGMIPWLKVLELMGRRSQPLSALVKDMRRAFPSSGEINFTIADPQACIKTIFETYKPLAAEFDWIDGLSMSFGDWRFNLRTSSTEPLVRLNVETRANPELLEEKTQELTRALGH
jgi:phosphomannomutase